MALVWHFAERNPFHYSLSRVIDRHADSPPPAPDALDDFVLLVLGSYERLNEAGATALSERLLQFTIEAPLSVEDFWTLRLEMSDKLREKIAALSKDQMIEVNRQALESLRELHRPGMSFTAEVLIVSGAKDRPSTL